MQKTTNEILFEIWKNEGFPTKTNFCKKLDMKGSSNMCMWLSNSKPLSIGKLEEICKKLNYKFEFNVEIK